MDLKHEFSYIIFCYDNEILKLRVIESGEKERTVNRNQFENLGEALITVTIKESLNNVMHDLLKSTVIPGCI